MTSVPTIYVYFINGKVQRRPARHPYMLISEIKENIKREHNLSFDFDLTYNGQEVSENSALHDNHFLEDIPLRVIPRQMKQSIHGSKSNKHPEPSISSPFFHQIARASQLGGLIFKNLMDELIEDETEPTSKTSCQLADKCQWKPSIEIHLPPAMPVDEEECIDLSSVTPRKHQTSRLQLLPIEEPPDETNVQPVGASKNSFYSTTIRVTGPMNISLSENSITITPRSAHSKAKYDVSKKLPVKECPQRTEHHSSSLEKDAAIDTNLIEIEENLPNQGNSPSNLHYHITF